MSWRRTFKYWSLDIYVIVWFSVSFQIISFEYVTYKIMFSIFPVSDKVYLNSPGPGYSYIQIIYTYEMDDIFEVSF